jgi:ribonuclease HI
MHWYVDGAGWNGRLSCYAIVSEKRQYPMEVVAKEFTNNEMEYQALIQALELASNGDTIFSDSQLIVNQVNGLWKVKEKSLRPYCEKARSLKEKKDVTLTWIPREQNRAWKLIESHQLTRTYSRV